MYLTELAPTNLRGAMGVLCPLGVTFGVLLGQIMSLSNVLGSHYNIFVTKFNIKSFMQVQKNIGIYFWVFILY